MILFELGSPVVSPMGLLARRVAVVGTRDRDIDPGAGAVRLEVPHINLDARNWQSGWPALSIEELERWLRMVAEAVARDGWITDGYYSKSAVPQILPRASDLI